MAWPNLEFLVFFFFSEKYMHFAQQLCSMSVNMFLLFLVNVSSVCVPSAGPELSKGCTLE